jgi:hypothetical protein
MAQYEQLNLFDPDFYMVSQPSVSARRSEQIQDKSYQQIQYIQLKLDLSTKVDNISVLPSIRLAA